MRYALAVAIIASLSFGLITESFRYQSTAGLWEDDYDLLFDPARIPQIEGSRVWTSLSNFVTGNEEPFSNGSVPFILVGGTRTFGEYHPGLVIDNRMSKNPLDTGLDDPFGNSMYGDGERVEIDWYDPDDNGIMDERGIAIETRSAFDVEAERDFYVGVGRYFGDLRVGLGFMRNEYNDKYTSPSSNYTYDSTYENLNPTELVIEKHVTFGGDDIYDYNNNEVILSVWKDNEKMSLGATAEFGLVSMKDERIILGDSATYSDPANHSVDYTQAVIVDSLWLPQSGMEVDLELKSFYDYNDYAQGRFYLGFFYHTLAYSDDATDYYQKTRDVIYDDFTWNYDTVVVSYSGGGNSMGVRLGTKQLFEISERLKLGFGFFYTMSNYVDEDTSFADTTRVTVYDDNDGITIDPNDYTTTVRGGGTWLTKTTGAVKAFEFPIGIEFYLAEPVVFRLGARHTLAFDDYTTVNNLIDYDPRITTTIRGDGTVTEDMIEPPNMATGSSESDTETTPDTDYFYGIGWQVTDNLQIDLMGFNELTDLSNWKLSATFKFD